MIVEIDQKDNITYCLIYRDKGKLLIYDMPFDWWEEMGYFSSPNEHTNEPTLEQAYAYLEFEHKRNGLDLTTVKNAIDTLKKDIST